MINIFVADLNKFLKESGKSSSFLAKAVGVSPSRITDWKNGSIQRYSEKPKLAHEIIRNYQKQNASLPKEIEDVIRDLLHSTNNQEHLINLLNSLKPFVNPKETSQNTNIDTGKDT
ncbi:transcriptional regulator [Hydrogenovibrio marinus]|uniref:Uncharacterized protein n=1 Tax=Hydrogenovibrio marinus TaxID=28885 RepID=A0A067A2A9_HYDMR|nr:transcriptional regulator [Hydrogenovibrio marinus]KDN96510.1 hypothetical protein EI16_09615 [Hydrogenovibrio marinus]BBN60291.1 hypothetical protein HVMH_1885 [Hydrogenovibrio marinus]